MRPVISYDDITLPYAEASSSPHSSIPPPSKKRKWSNHKQPSHQAHGKISNSNTSRHLNPFSTLGVEDTDAKVESRELLHEDIWDDSVLIAAWNAATEEYESYNGPEKGWKTEPVHKSPLWYNMPPSPLTEGFETNHTEDSIQKNVPGTNDQEDSTPLDFDTFVPSHNPSLDLPFNSSSAPGIDHTSQFLLEPPGNIPDEDEAFTRALGAMYWGGYWTAVYHCRRSDAHKRARDEGVTDHDDNNKEELAEPEPDSDKGEDGEGLVEIGFVSTER